MEGSYGRLLSYYVLVVMFIIEGCYDMYLLLWLLWLVAIVVMVY